MSGINPVLDTLLHQVLGRRVPAPPAPQTEPVRAMFPGEAPLAVRSDSRLDPRALPRLPTSPSAIAQHSEQRPAAPARTLNPDLAPPSARTHFSPAARAIADLLARFPAPPSFVQPAAPLLKAQEPATLPQLAARLRDTIEHSGLFYQSHLARWFRGELPLASLAREPQMQMTRPVLSRRLAHYTRISPPPAHEASAVRETPAASPRINDALQGILRHQLEVLAAPVLNWQGEVWPGWTLLLTFSWAPPLAERDASDDGEQETGEASSRDWSLSMTLTTAALGTVHVRLRERRGNLAVCMQCTEKERVMQLRSHIDQLHGVLILLGFNRARISVSLLPAGEQDDEKA